MPEGWHETCGHTWENLSEPKYRGEHTCRRDPQHDGEHVCSCGAQSDEVLSA